MRLESVDCDLLSTYDGASLRKSVKNLKTDRIARSIKMKYLAAYLLLQLGGKDAPSAADVKSVVESVGIDVDEERVSTLIKELEGKTISEVRENC